LRGGLVHTPDKLELQDPNREVGTKVIARQEC
jgi:hypothetical protein